MFGMGTGVTLSLKSPKRSYQLNIDGSAKPLALLKPCVHDEFYGQAERAISNGKLNVLPRFHIRPIKLVVFQCPS